MLGRELAQAFVRLRVDSNAVAADTTRGIEKGANAPAVAAAGKKAGAKTGKGFGGAFSSQLRSGLPAIAREGENAGKTWGAKFGAAAGAVTTRVAKIGGIALAAGLIGAVKASSDFEAAMKRIQTQAGASGRDVKTLSADILAMRNVQQTPIELANAMYHLKSVGLDNVNAMKALRQASNLAAVGNANLEDTTNALAGAWRTGISGAKNFGTAASTINAIIGAGNMRLSDFVGALSTGVLPAAKTFGLSLRQVGAALALMTDEGIPAVDAATRLRMSFSLLAAPSAAADKWLGTIGLSGTDLAKAMRGPDGLIGALSLLKDHLSSLSKVQQSQILSRAFGGGRQSAAILSLINNLDVLRKKQEQIDRSLGRFGPAVVTQSKTASAQFHMLGADMERIGIVVGNKVLPPVTAFFGWLAKDRNLMPVLLGLLGAITAALVIQAAAWLATPIGQVTTAIALLVVGIVLLKQHWGQVWGFVLHTTQAVWGWIKTHWPLLAVILAGPFGLAAIVIAKHWRGIATGAKELWRYLGPLFRIGWDLIAGSALLAWFVIRKVFGFIADRATSAWHTVSGGAKVAWGIIHPILNVLGDVASFIFRKVIWPAAQYTWGRVVSVIKGAIDFGKAAMRALWTVISAVFGFIIHGAARAFGWLPGLGPKLKDAARQFDIFRNRVNAAITGINGRTVQVGVSFGLGIGKGQLWHKAQGGPIYGKGTGTSDSNLAWVSHGEWVIKQSSAAKYGDKAMAAVNEGKATIAYNRGGPVAYAAGGGVNIRTVLPTNAQIKANIGPTLQTLAQRWFSSQGMFLGLPGAIPGGGGGGSWVGVILTALRLLHQSPAWLGIVMHRLMQESGGNAFAVNRWDINWLLGHPSVGGMQVIGPTFAAYAGPFRRVGPFLYGVSVNRLANMFAALNYALHRYGSLAALARPGGYALGGPVRKYDSPRGTWMPPGLSLSYNGTGAWEHLRPTRGDHQGPLFGDVNVYDATDYKKVEQQLTWAWMRAAP